MRFTIQFPLNDPDRSGEMSAGDYVAAFSREAEDAGFDAIAFTEHPAPSSEWLWSPHGHASLDPFAALGFCAAVTQRLTLMPYLAVAAYRNPFMLAKAATTVDRLSRGRLVLTLGTGYQRNEFDAVGARFSKRAALLDEMLDVLPQIWSGTAISGMSGDGWTAASQQARPLPTRTGGPPIWIGGNSQATLRRVARSGQGWAPLMIAPSGSTNWIGTSLDTLDRLDAAITELRRLAAEAGRADEKIDIQLKTPSSRMRLAQFDAKAHLAEISELAGRGVTHFVVHPMDERDEDLRELIRVYGREVIDRCEKSGELAASGPS